MEKRNINIQEKKCKCLSKAWGCTERWAIFKIFNQNKSDQNHWRGKGQKSGCSIFPVVKDSSLLWSRIPKSEVYAKTHQLTHLCIIAGWNQEVSEHQELVICELLLVLLPVVMVGPPEIGQCFLHSHLPAQLGWSSVSQGSQLHTKTNVGHNKHNCSVPPRAGADPDDRRALGNSAQDFNFHSSG